MNTFYYCHSRYQTKRNKTRVVHVGNIAVGGDNPIRLQSMTNTLTQDVRATVRQTIALVEAGCEIVRVTAQNMEAAKALKDIRAELNKAKIFVPLVADIHFLPKVAMEAVEHVEKVRINPGNYADKKKFTVKEYSGREYQEELERLHETFSPLVIRAKELGRSLRIGTNHGSLSDRIMNRYGDTPLGMTESALEFIRIAESHGFHDIILSMKASNPKVMIQAYRLVVQKMKQENMFYPLHLGVTEASDGEDARIKSAIGIGSLLADGIGDTIRVSLTEDPVCEVPVTQDLANIAHTLWKTYQNEVVPEAFDAVDPFTYSRLKTLPLKLIASVTATPPPPSNLQPEAQTTTRYPPPLPTTQKLETVPPPPPVWVKPHIPLENTEALIQEIISHQSRYKENKIEGLIFQLSLLQDLTHIISIQNTIAPTVDTFILELPPPLPPSAFFRDFTFFPSTNYTIVSKFTEKGDLPLLIQYLEFINSPSTPLNLKLAIDTAPTFIQYLKDIDLKNTLVTASPPPLGSGMHPIGTYRAIVNEFRKLSMVSPPLWLRNTFSNTINLQNFFTSRLLEASIFSGSLLCDGIGDILSIETEPSLSKATILGYNILQASRLRLSKAEFVACPSCGRTLFDLEKTTQAIRAKTGHLKGITIAIMGCIVNGPGEMADADFGYVGGAPGKINLYVGKECVQYHIPQEEAVDHLIALIKKHNKWVEPDFLSSTQNLNQNIEPIIN